MEEDTIAYRAVAKWSTDEVVSWMRGLHKSLEEHIPQFLAHCICGVDLLKMTHQQLEYLKVTQMGHQELLLEAVEMLSALERGRSLDFTLSLASTLSKKTSQLMHTINTPLRKRQEEAELSSLRLREATSGVMMAAKLLLNWLDRNPCSLVDDYDSFRSEVLKGALNLANMTNEDFDVQQMKDSCRAILKFTAVMMSPQSLSCMEPIKLLTVQLQPRDDSGLGFSIQRTRQGNLMVNHVVPESPAFESHVIVPGVEIVQINHQNVVGWEMNEVIETLKASGHQVSLIINTGNAKMPPPQSNAADLHQDGQEDGGESIGENSTLQHLDEERHTARSERNDEDAAKSISQSQEESSDDLTLSSAKNDPTSLSTNYSSEKSSSQDTLDDIAESPESLEGDTDFSGMENLLNRHHHHHRMPLDLHRTSSAPLSGSRDVGGALEVSTDSSSTTGTHDGELSLVSDVTGSLEALGGQGMGSFESRLTTRTGSDNTVGVSERLSASKVKKPQSHLPQVAYRTQIIGGVVMRVPIKQDDQEKPKEKKVRHQRQRSRHKKSRGVGMTVRAGEGPGSGDAAAEGVGEAQAAANENGTAGGGGSPEKGKAVFSDLKEVTIGGHTTKQITVSSSTEIVGGKKSSNPALMVPCFQLKEADREGFMYKLGGSGFTPKNWRRRWFVLKDRKLFYYKTSFDIAALGIVNMAGYSMEISPESKKKHAFKAIKEGQRTYYFYTDTHDEMTSWMDVLSKSTEGGQDITDGQATIEASDDEL